MARNSKIKEAKSRYETGTITDFLDAYKNRPLISKIIDLTSNEALKNPLTIKNGGEDVQKYLDKINFTQNIISALKITQIYGSCLIVLELDDAKDLTEPVNENVIRKCEIAGIYGYGAFDLEFNDVTKELEYYKLTNQTKQLKIHPSRALLLQNNPLFLSISNPESLNNSTITKLLPAVLALEYFDAMTFGSYEKSLMDVLKIDYEKLAKEAESFGEDVVRGKMNGRIGAFDKSKASGDTLLIDKNDNIDRLQASYNFSEFRASLERNLSSVSHVPLAFFGADKSGNLSNSSDSELEIFYNYIKTLQSFVLKSGLDRFFFYLAKLFKMQDLSYEFAKLWNLSPKEQAELEAKNASTIQILASIPGLKLNPEQIALAFDGKYIDVKQSTRNITLNNGVL